MCGGFYVVLDVFGSSAGRGGLFLSDTVSLQLPDRKSVYCTAHFHRACVCACVREPTFHQTDVMMRARQPRSCDATTWRDTGAALL